MLVNWNLLWWPVQRLVEISHLLLTPKSGRGTYARREGPDINIEMEIQRLISGTKIEHRPFDIRIDQCSRQCLVRRRQSQAPQKPQPCLRETRLLTSTRRGSRDSKLGLNAATGQISTGTAYLQLVKTHLRANYFLSQSRMHKGWRRLRAPI